MHLVIVYGFLGGSELEVTVNLYEGMFLLYTLNVYFMFILMISNMFMCVYILSSQNHVRLCVCVRMFVYLIQRILKL